LLTNKQTNGRTDERTNKQTTSQPNTQPNTQTYKTPKQANAQTNEQTSALKKQTKTQANKQPTMSGPRGFQPGQAQGAFQPGQAQPGQAQGASNLVGSISTPPNKKTNVALYTDLSRCIYVCYQQEDMSFCSLPRLEDMSSRSAGRPFFLLRYGTRPLAQQDDMSPSSSAKSKGRESMRL